MDSVRVCCSCKSRHLSSYISLLYVSTWLNYLSAYEVLLTKWNPFIAMSQQSVITPLQRRNNFNRSCGSFSTDDQSFYN